MNDLMLFLHVFAVIVAVGGMHTVLLVIGPVARRLNTPAASEFAAAAAKKFRVLVWASIALLVLTGAHLLFGNPSRKLLSSPLASLVVLKVVVALFVFAISLGLTLPFRAFEKMQAKRMLWLRINILIAAVVIFLGVYIAKR